MSSQRLYSGDIKRGFKIYQINKQITKARWILVSNVPLCFPNSIFGSRCVRNGISRTIRRKIFMTTLYASEQYDG